MKNKTVVAIALQTNHNIDNKEAKLTYFKPSLQLTCKPTQTAGGNRNRPKKNSPTACNEMHSCTRKQQNMCSSIPKSETLFLSWETQAKNCRKSTTFPPPPPTKTEHRGLNRNLSYCSERLRSGKPGRSITELTPYSATNMESRVQTKVENLGMYQCTQTP